jgi:diguanylate cyclase (GGDEF)-like protein
VQANFAPCHRVILTGWRQQRQLALHEDFSIRLYLLEKIANLRWHDPRNASGTGNKGMAMTSDLMEMRQAARKSAKAANAQLYTPPGKTREKSRIAFLGGEIGRLLRQLDIAHAVIARHEERIEQLEALATTDELTGIANRRGFYNTFSVELARCERGLSSGGLIVMIDLDNFKSINDMHGHAAGDACLRLVAQTLADEIRPTDSAARLGGDEFVLLLAGADRNGAAARVQTIAWQLNHLSLVWEGKEISIGASIGMRDYATGATAESVLGAADLAMYATKKHQGGGKAAAAAHA